MAPTDAAARRPGSSAARLLAALRLVEPAFSSRDRAGFGSKLCALGVFETRPIGHDSCRSSDSAHLRHGSSGVRVTIGQSHGKARSDRARRRDLKLVGPGGEPNGTRASGGRFAKGNGVGKGRGIKAEIRRHLGRDASSPVVESIARSVRVVEAGLRKSLPSQDGSVLLMTQARATWSVLQQHVTTLALDAGLTTEAGRQYLELALKLDTRAERLAITSLDIATKLAEAERKATPQTFAWLQGLPDDDTDDEPDASASATGDAGTASATSESETLTGGRLDASAHVTSDGDGDP